MTRDGAILPRGFAASPSSLEGEFSLRASQAPPLRQGRCREATEGYDTPIARGRERADAVRQQCSAASYCLMREPNSSPETGEVSRSDGGV